MKHALRACGVSLWGLPPSAPQHWPPNSNPRLNHSYLPRPTKFAYGAIVSLLTVRSIVITLSCPTRRVKVPVTPFCMPALRCPNADKFCCRHSAWPVRGQHPAFQPRVRSGGCPQTGALMRELDVQTHHVSCMVCTCAHHGAFFAILQAVARCMNQNQRDATRVSDTRHTRRGASRAWACLSARAQTRMCTGTAATRNRNGTSSSRKETMPNPNSTLRRHAMYAEASILVSGSWTGSFAPTMPRNPQSRNHTARVD